QECVGAEINFGIWSAIAVDLAGEIDVDAAALARGAIYQPRLVIRERRAIDRDLGVVTQNVQTTPRASRAIIRHDRIENRNGAFGGSDFIEADSATVSIFRNVVVKDAVGNRQAAIGSTSADTCPIEAAPRCYESLSRGLLRIVAVANGYTGQ